jgi:hypothetical protein
MSAVAMHEIFMDILDSDGMVWHGMAWHGIFHDYIICVRHSSSPDDTLLVDEQIEVRDEINEAIMTIRDKSSFFLSKI